MKSQTSYHTPQKWFRNAQREEMKRVLRSDDKGQRKSFSGHLTFGIPLASIVLSLAFISFGKN